MADLKAQLEITADASGVETGVGKAKRSLSDLGVTAAKAGKDAAGGLEGIGKGGAQSAQKIDAATKNMIGSIQRTTAVLEAGSRTSSKYFETLAAQRGVDVNALKPYLAQLDQVAAKQEAAKNALNSAKPAFDQMGMSAKQSAFALRQVPMQVTDMITSLQAGQAPMTVFLQQGGQLKDMFGGIGPAVRAVGGYVAGLINPFTVAAAAAAGLTYAYLQGAKEAGAYNRALIMTGSVVGVTSGQLNRMAEAIGDVAGTQGKAATALAELAGTGRIAAGNLEEFARVAVKMEKVVGKSAQDTAKDLAELGKAPLDASVKLNDQYRYLTASVYAQIRALEDQGRMEDAAAVAQKAYADAMSDRADQVEQQLTRLERGWAAIANEAGRAWDSMKRVFDGPTLSDLYGQLNLAVATGASDAEISDIENRINVLKKLDEEQRKVAESKAAEVKQEQARIKWFEDGEQFLSKQVKMEREIAAARVQGSAAGATQAEIERRIADIRDKYKDKAAIRAGLQIDKAKLGADLDAIQNALASLTNTYDNAERILEARRSAGLIGEKDYWEAKRSFIRLQEQAEVDHMQQQIDRLNAEKATGDKKIENDRKVADLMAKMASLRAKAATDIEVLSTQETSAIDRVTRSYEEARQAAQSYIDTIRKQYSREIEGAGRGSLQRERDGTRNRTDDRYESQRQDLARDLRRGQITQDQYDSELEIINRFHEEALKLDEKYWADKLSLQGNWQAGASEAFQNYLNDASNVFKQTEELTAKAFGGMEDALVNFVMTGKASFGDLAKSIIADLIRIQIRQQATKMFSSLLGFLSPGALPSMDGGGYTGSAPRSGGLDGKGGFLAIMHPRETVIDHTKSQSGADKGAAQAPVTVIQNFTVGDVATVSMVRQAVAGSEKRIAGAMGRSMNYGGALS